MANGGKQNHIADDGKMMSKMTDKEIKEALECCDDFGWCGQCSLQGVIDCKTMLTDNALDLINRQQAEIERLKGTVEMYEEERKYHFEMSKQKVAEAIKELEVKIHEKLHQAEMHGNFEPVVTREMFDSVVREMVGEGK
jgi:hypothetical protein